MNRPYFPLSRRALGATTLAVLLACHGSYALAATPKDTLVVAFAFDDIITMDPGEAFEISAGEIMGNTYDRLLRYDVNDPSKLIADLAKSWSVSADGKTYTFELKPGLKFASGNPITAEDVVFSFQRAVLLDKSPAFILTQFGLSKDNVKDKVRQTGPLTLTFETDKSYAPTFVYNCLTANIAAIVDKKLVLSKEVNGDLGYAWLKTNYAGSGPLKLREWRANEIIALERNDNYYGEKSKMARVIYRHVKEAASQRLQLEKGDVDIARNLSPEDLAALAANKSIKTTSTPKGTVYYISLNQKNPNLAKPEVREAMKWLVDYAAIGDTLIKNIGTINQNFMPVGLLGASKERPYKLDVDKAKPCWPRLACPTGSRSPSTCARCSRCRALPKRSSRPPSAPASTSRYCPATASRPSPNTGPAPMTCTSDSGAPTTGTRTPTRPSCKTPTTATMPRASHWPGAMPGQRPS